MADRPTGTVTFLYSDIEGSTRLWERHHQAMPAAVARHEGLLRQAVDAHGGQVFRTVGDGLCAAFATAPDAVAAALAAQQALTAEPWGQTGPLRVRLALHTGAVEARAGDYVGPCLNRLARLLAVGHGGQILLSQTTADLTRDALPHGASLGDLGEQRLRDLVRPEPVYQVLHPALPAEFPPLRSLDAYPHNLALQLTSFVGREAEMAEVRRLLTATRLLTLTGTGGCGKTRLALQVAADLVDQYPDGVWLVELAPLTDPELVAQTVAFGIGIAEQPGQPMTTTLVGALRSRRLLLVLDNCEHLLDACAGLTEALLRGCPGVRVLATSRELLGVEGETAWRVPSLAAPDPRHLPPADQLLDFPAVWLFVERARQVQPAFAPVARAAALAQICARLDGIPLAIELAAARVTALSVEQIAARLDDRFRLLTGGRRTALRRQQTLEVAIDWSHALLTEPERILLRRLAVFAGGWSLEAAEVVGAGDGVEAVAVVDLLTRLVEKSLVVADDQAPETRYRLLETIRQYASEKLLASGEAMGVRDRHRDWYLALTEQAALALRGPEVGVWLVRLETEHDNLRAALEWSLADPAGAEAGLRLAGALGWFWWVRDHLREGLGWLERALARREEAPSAARTVALASASWLAARISGYDHAAVWGEEWLALSRAQNNQRGTAEALSWLGAIAQDRGDYFRAQRLLDEGLALARLGGDVSSAAWLLFTGGRLANFRGEYLTARMLVEESLALYRRLGDPVGTAFTLTLYGRIVARLGEHRRAQTLQEESLAIKEPLGMRRGIAVSVQCLGDVARLEGDVAESEARSRQALRLLKDIGDRETMMWSLGGLAWAAATRGQGLRAARLFGSMAALRAATGLVVPLAEREEYERDLAAARELLDDEAFLAAYAAGQAMTLDEAIVFALGDEPAGGPTGEGPVGEGGH